MRKIVVPICIIGLMLVFSGLSVNATTTINKIDFNNSHMPQATNMAVTNITVNETWDMLTNSGDGIQFYIDVRRNDEWMAERIDTPLPEHPRHYNLHLLQDATLLEKFMSLYGGVDTLIIGCKSGGRSWKAANIILNAGFTGTIYNMIGGLLGWKAAGRPTVVQGGLYNITVDEVAQLCIGSKNGNGIQIPIDVRRDDEWNEGYIDTPYPECPVWYCKDLLETEEGLEEFLRTYEGNEVIMYCKGGYRSLLSAYMLLEGDFNGTIYNMLGGITDWIAQGHPIRNNTKPDAPTVNGPAKGGVNADLVYNLSTADAEGDGVSYIIDWGDNTSTETDLYAITEECVVTHNYSAKKTYTIIAKAVDFYGNESDPTNFEVKIPRMRANNFKLWNWLFERFPILRQLIGL